MRAWISFNGAVMALAACVLAPAVSAKPSSCIDASTRVASDKACATGKSPEEIAGEAKRARDDAIAVEGKRLAVKSDLQLLGRFPDAASHSKLWVADLQDVVVAMRGSLDRYAQLVRERKPIDDELEFHRGKAPPPELQRRLDASESSFAALRDTFARYEQQIRSIEQICRNRQDYLLPLWRGEVEPGARGLYVERPATSK